MKFRYSHLTQKQLGQLFGVSSHVIGRWLIELGLKDPKTKKPTQHALFGGLCRSFASENGGPNWSWSAQSTVQLLVEKGHPMVSDLPESLVEPTPLRGPFTVSTHNSKAILDGDGLVAVRTTGRRNSEAVATVLNLAHRHGVIERLMGAIGKPEAAHAT